MSLSFSDLPFDVLPLVIQHITKPQHLSQLCLVNKNFSIYASALLYHHPAIFAWHKGAKIKARLLFTTLANSSHLARHVRRLELRDFPKDLSRQDRQELIDTCVRGIENCINLVECIWTRDGSLRDEILEALSLCPRLSSLEINGHSSHNYDPGLLTMFSRLSHLSVIMPSSEIIAILPICFHQNHASITSLTLICKFTSVITDDWLKSVSSGLSSLKKFHIAGCPKVTHLGVKYLLATNTVGIADLALEGISTSFDMKEFRAFCTQTQALSQLVSISLALPTALIHGGLKDIEELLHDSPLTSFHLYASSGQSSSAFSLDKHFVQLLMDRHAGHLQRFAVLRIPIDHPTLDIIVKRGKRLEQLYISHGSATLKYLETTMRITTQTRTIRSLHVNYSNENSPGQVQLDSELEESDGYRSNWGESQDANDGTQSLIPGLPKMEDIEYLANLLPGTIRQFGLQTRVWQVEKDVESGKIKLGPYERPDIPGAFLVVRT